MRLINFNETAFIVASAAAAVSAAAAAVCNSVANVATWFNQPNAISLAPTVPCPSPTSSLCHAEWQAAYELCRIIFRVWQAQLEL